MQHNNFSRQRTYWTMDQLLHQTKKIFSALSHRLKKTNNLKEISFFHLVHPITLQVLLPLSKGFLWALYQKDTRATSKRSRKDSTWQCNWTGDIPCILNLDALENTYTLAVHADLAKMWYVLCRMQTKANSAEACQKYMDF